MRSILSNMVFGLLAAASVVSADPGLAHGVKQSGSKAAAIRNIVLVHGAFADGSGWRGVYDDLTRRGYRVTVVQNPLTSLADDVAATRRALDRQDGPAILVGHSWGGTVITQAGEHPLVAGLVYAYPIFGPARAARGHSAGSQPDEHS